MLIPRFLPVVGGTERQCWLLSRELVKKGIKVFVLTQREKRTSYFEKMEGVAIYRLPGFAIPRFPSFGFFFSSLLFLVVFRTKYEIVYVHLATSLAAVAILVSKLLKKKIVVKFGGAGFTGDVGTSRKKLLGGLKLKLIRDNFDFFIAPSKEVESELIGEKFSKGRIKLIPNGVDVEYFSPSTAKEKENLKKRWGCEEKKVFLFVGRIEPPKDVFFLLSAWKQVLAKEKILFLIGGGKEEEKVKNFLKKEGIRDVILLGERKDIKQFYQMADLFILPTRAEGLSNSLLEAMASGLVVLASGIPSNRDVVKNGENGFLFSMETKNSLEFLIEGVLEDNIPLGEIGRNARKTVCENFSISLIAELFKKKLIFAP
ncbi:MAG: glycosyltransferase family 4 protein [Elusimicrobia bacterium]|nr:glycosyltransferase family 4 protein [Elusimicrobiota bacterium]